MYVHLPSIINDFLITNYNRLGIPSLSIASNVLTG
jgi:hypothetical protein